MNGRRLLGLGTAACVACCAPLLLPAVGGIAVFGVAGTLVFSVISLVAAGVSIAALIGLRRRAQTRKQAQAQPVHLGPSRTLDGT